MNQELESLSLKRNIALIAAAVMSFHLACSFSASVVLIFSCLGCVLELGPTKAPLP